MRWEPWGSLMPLLGGLKAAHGALEPLSVLDAHSAHDAHHANMAKVLAISQSRNLAISVASHTLHGVSAVTHSH